MSKKLPDFKGKFVSAKESSDLVVSIFCRRCEEFTGCSLLLTAGKEPSADDFCLIASVVKDAIRDPQQLVRSINQVKAVDKLLSQLRTQLQVAGLDRR